MLSFQVTPTNHNPSAGERASGDVTAWMSGSRPGTAIHASRHPFGPSQHEEVDSAKELNPQLTGSVAVSSG